MRRALIDPERDHRRASVVPGLHAWIDASVAEPQTDVEFMGSLANELRLLEDEKGLVASGIVAIGDAVMTTNPHWDEQRQLRGS